MSHRRQIATASMALGATLLGFSGVIGDRLSLVLIGVGLILALALTGRASRRAVRGNR